MARSWIAGLLTGAVVTGIGLGVVSLLMGPVAPVPDRAPVAQAPVEPPQAEPAQSEPAQSEPAPGEAPEAPESPVTSPVTDAAAPVAPAETPAPVVEPPAPESPAPSAASASTEPEAAQTESEPTEPALAEPAQTEPVQAEPAQAEPVQAEPEPTEPVQAEPAQAEAASQPEAPANPAGAPAPDQTLAPQAEAPAMAPAAPQEGSATTAPEPAPEPEPAPDTAPETAPDVAPAPTALPEIIVEPEPEPVAPAPTPGIGNVIVTPEADLAPEAEASPGEAVVTNRLPRIGAAPAAAPVVAPEPALSRNALAFAPVGDQPRLAFLLLDTGAEDRAGLGDLGKLPFPVTVAIDASAPDAEAALAFYRAQGAEVMLTVPLPDGATPTDVDVTIEAYKPLLAQAIGVLTEENAGFQTLGAGAVQLATNLAETGHGLVTWPAGLNTGYKAALKEGVKAGLVFRDLDGAGQEGAVIRRFLDNAAFKARNQDGVIVVARTRPKTLQALLEWSLGTRAQSVALVPVSAILAGAPTTP